MAMRRVAAVIAVLAVVTMLVALGLASVQWRVRRRSVTGGRRTISR